MALTEAELNRRLRHVYEWGRLRATLRDSWTVIPVALFALAQHRLSPPAIGCALALLGLLTVLSWRGKVWRRALWAGVLIGAVPLLMPALAPRNEMCVIGGACLSFCLVACSLSGLISGLALGRVAVSQPTQRLEFLAAAGAVAAMMGSFGCAMAGAAGLLGMAIGGSLGLAPVYWTLARSAR